MRRVRKSDDGLKCGGVKIIIRKSNLDHYKLDLSFSLKNTNLLKDKEQYLTNQYLQFPDSTMSFKPLFLSVKVHDGVSS